MNKKKKGTNTESGLAVAGGDVPSETVVGGQLRQLLVPLRRIRWPSF